MVERFLHVSQGLVWRYPVPYEVFGLFKGDCRAFYGIGVVGEGDGQVNEHLLLYGFRVFFPFFQEIPLYRLQLFYCPFLHALAQKSVLYFLNVSRNGLAKVPFPVQHFAVFPERMRQIVVILVPCYIHVIGIQLHLFKFIVFLEKSNCIDETERRLVKTDLEVASQYLILTSNISSRKVLSMSML